MGGWWAVRGCCFGVSKRLADRVPGADSVLLHEVGWQGGIGTPPRLTHRAALYHQRANCTAITAHMYRCSTGARVRDP